MLLAAAAWLPACGPRGDAALEVVAASRRRALDEPIVLRCDRALDALSLTPRSVRVALPDGAPVEAAWSVRGEELLVSLVVDERLLDDPPDAVRVRLAGLPSPHAVRGADGAALARPYETTVALDPRLAGAGGARLVEVNGRPTDRRGEIAHDGVLTLVFEGAVDPGSVAPEACPLFPVAGGLQLKPVLPETRWSLLGSRCEVRLLLPPDVGPLELVWRRLGLRDLAGRPPDGPLLLTLTSS